jgi:hypothetical protein
MDSVLIFISQFVVFSLILGFYLLRRHALRKEASFAKLFHETTFSRKVHMSKWLRLGSKPSRSLKT